MLNKEERKRYQRQLILSNFGEVAQEKIKHSKVLIVGAGGLGSPVSIYLAAAGVGHIVICDCDKVELSNLNRQILHSTLDISKQKSNSAKESLSNLNPEITIDTHTVKIDNSNIEGLAMGVDLIVDCLDNIETRLALNSCSLKNNIPIMHAGIDSWTAQITLLQPPETACMNCLFSDYIETDAPKPVIGAMAGIVGTIQAFETLKYLAKTGVNLKNKLLYFDGLNQEWTKLDLSKSDDCKICNSHRQ